MINTVISRCGVTPLHVFKCGSIDAEVYPKCLEDMLLPGACHLYPEGNWLFQQNNALPHMAHSTVEFLEGESPDWIRLNEWCSNTLQVVLCNFFFGDFTHKVFKSGRSFANEIDLIAQLLKVVVAYPVDLMQKAICSQMRGVQAHRQALVDAVSDHLKYCLPSS